MREHDRTDATPPERGPRRALAVHAIAGGAEGHGEALLEVPALSIQPLYPGGYFPLLRLMGVEDESVADETAAQVRARLRESADARLRMDWIGALRAAEHAAAVAAEAGLRALEADAHAEAAGVAVLAGDAGEAETLARGAMDGGSADARFRAALCLAIVDGLAGRHDAALAAMDEAGRQGEADDERRAFLMANRSAVLLGVGRMDLAEAAAAEALKAGRRRKDDYLASIGGFAAALAHLARGRRGDARSRLGEAVRGFARAGDVLRQVQCHHLLGEIAYDGEDPIRAGSHYRDALALARAADAHDAVDLLTLRFEHR